MMSVHAFRAGKDKCGAAFRLQTQRLRTGQGSDLVGPRTGGIDKHRCAERLAIGLYDPQAIGIAAQAEHFAICAHFAVVAPDAAQVALMQRVGVDVTGRWVVDRAVDFFPAQDRQTRAGFVGAEQLHLRHRGFGAEVLVVQFGGITDEVDGHFAARGQQWVLAKTARRTIEKRAARLSQCADLCGAVGGGVQRGGATGGVIAGMGFTLEHDHFAVRRQPEPGGSAGNPAADDDEICVAHVGLQWVRNIKAFASPLWERACSRKRCISRHLR